MIPFSWKSLFHLTFLFWVIMDSLGTLPLFVSLLKHFDTKKQQKIIIRELLIALAIMIIFFFTGHGFLKVLHITPSSLQISGGIILFLLAVKMIFAKPHFEKNNNKIPKDPLIVPLAVPSIAGPGILALIALYGGGIENPMTVLEAIFLAWLFTFGVLIISPWLNKKLNANGIVAVERLFGFVIVLISTQMALNGFTSFPKTMVP